MKRMTPQEYSESLPSEEEQEEINKKYLEMMHEFYDYCESEGIEPIIGRIRTVDDDLFDYFIQGYKIYYGEKGMRDVVGENVCLHINHDDETVHVIPDVE